MRDHTDGKINGWETAKDSEIYGSNLNFLLNCCGCKNVNMEIEEMFLITI